LTKTSGRDDADAGDAPATRLSRDRRAGDAINDVSRRTCERTSARSDARDVVRVHERRRVRVEPPGRRRRRDDEREGFVGAAAAAWATIEINIKERVLKKGVRSSGSGRRARWNRVFRRDFALGVLLSPTV